jgi:hypothetical protein
VRAKLHAQAKVAERLAYLIGRYAEIPCDGGRPRDRTAAQCDAHSTDTDEPLNRYDQHDLIVFRELAVPILRHLGVRETARRTGLGLGSVGAALSGRSIPRTAAIGRYPEIAYEHATDLLKAAGIQPAQRAGGESQASAFAHRLARQPAAPRLLDLGLLGTLAAMGQSVGFVGGFKLCPHHWRESAVC